MPPDQVPPGFGGAKRIAHFGRWFNSKVKATIARAAESLAGSRDAARDAPSALADSLLGPAGHSQPPPSSASWRATAAW